MTGVTQLDAIVWPAGVETPRFVNKGSLRSLGISRRRSARARAERRPVHSFTKREALASADKKRYTYFNYRTPIESIFFAPALTKTPKGSFTLE